MGTRLHLGICWLPFVGFANMDKTRTDTTFDAGMPPSLAHAKEEAGDQVIPPPRLGKALWEGAE